MSEELKQESRRAKELKTIQYIDRAIKNISSMSIFFCPSFLEYQRYEAFKENKRPEDVTTIDPLRLLYMIKHILDGSYTGGMGER